MNKLKYAALPLVLLLGVAVYLASQMSFGPAGKILPGVYLLDADLSGLTEEQALASIKKLEQKFRQPIMVKYKDLSWSLPMSRVDLRIDCSKEVQQAMKIGRTGSLWQRITERRLAHEGLHLKPAIFLDTPLLEKVVTEAAEVIMLPPKDAGLIINADNSVEISPGHSGRLVEIGQLEQDIKQTLLNNAKEPIELRLSEVPPARTTEAVQAMGVDTLLGVYTTEFDPNMTNRAYNISVAAAAIDGLIAGPQEVISFNEVVGPRSTEAGYKDAPIIVNNELVDGLGGGVCQVSTTLYNTVLLSNLKVIERTNHSMPISYVPIGRDATVVFDALDFKFQNNTEYWLYIQSFIKGGWLTVKIFGNSNYKRDVVIRSWVEETYLPETVLENDYSIKMGDRVVKQKGAQGYRASAERIVMQNGKVIGVEKLPSSFYKAKNQIISQGMAPPGSILKTPDMSVDKVSKESLE